MIHSTPCGLLRPLALKRVSIRMGHWRKKSKVEDLPQFHVGFHLQEVLESNSPGTTGRSLQHESSELRMKVWRLLSIPRTVRASVSTIQTASTYWSPSPPCSLPPAFHRASSRARDFKISACAKDRRAFLFPSSRATTRYST